MKLPDQLVRGFLVVVDAMNFLDPEGRESSEGHLSPVRASASERQM